MCSPRELTPIPPFSDLPRQYLKNYIFEGKKWFAFVFLMGHSIWSFIILAIGIGLKGVAYVLATTEEEIEAYLGEGDDHGSDDHGDDDHSDDDGHRRQLSRAVSHVVSSRRLSEGWSAKDYDEHLHDYLDMICWCIFCHLLFGEQTRQIQNCIYLVLARRTHHHPQPLP